MTIKLILSLLIFFNILLSESLTEKKNSIITQTPVAPFSCKSLFLSIKENSLEKIDSNLLNCTDENRENILFYAIRQNNLKLVNDILDWNHVLINQRNINLSSTLHVACKKNNYNIVKKLLESKINVSFKDIYGHKALYYAKLRGNSEIISLLNHYMDISAIKKREKKDNSLNNFIKNFNKPSIDEM